jgi:hypothetical protein
MSYMSHLGCHCVPAEPQLLRTGQCAHPELSCLVFSKQSLATAESKLFRHFRVQTPVWLIYVQFR